MHVKWTAITPPHTDHVTKCDIDEIALYPNPNPNSKKIMTPNSTLPVSFFNLQEFDNE